MDLGLRGKVCLVTGASSGIGRATAVMLAAEGARVVGTARSEAAFAAVADEVRTAGGVDPVLLVADFAEDGAAERLVAAVLARAGQVDVLVNNAGGSRPMTVPDDGTVWTMARNRAASSHKLVMTDGREWLNGRAASAARFGDVGQLLGKRRDNGGEFGVVRLFTGATVRPACVHRESLSGEGREKGGYWQGR